MRFGGSAILIVFLVGIRVTSFAICCTNNDFREVKGSFLYFDYDEVLFKSLMYVNLVVSDTDVSSFAVGFVIGSRLHAHVDIIGNRQKGILENQ